MKGKKHWWKEIDGDGNAVRICQIDKNVNRWRWYIYIDNKISRVSRWKEGIETEVLKTFRVKKDRIQR